MRDKYEFTPDPNTPHTHTHYHAELAHLFAVNKQRRTQSSDKAMNDLRQRLVNVGAMNDNQIHQALHDYERAYLTGGGNWLHLKTLLQLRYRPSIDIVESPGSADIFMTKNSVRARIGTVHFGMMRFVPIGVQPFGNNPVIYERRQNPGRHYVFLPNSGTYTRRFVTRGLSAYDGMRLTQGLGLLAVQQNQHAQQSEIGGVRHNLPQGQVLTFDQMILSHTRGWGGNKRFISTGVSNRPAISTRGEQFQSIYGAVVVDLAQLPPGTVYDMHLPGTSMLYIGRDPQEILNTPHHTGTNDLPEQEYLALRDVLRTRELLIYGSIPPVAISALPAGRVLLGIGSATNAEHNGVLDQANALPPPAQNAIVATDQHTFRDPGTNRRWTFFLFSSVGMCVLAHSHFALHGQQVKVRFEKYTPVRPAGMV